KILKESPSLEKHITRIQESIDLEDRFVRGGLFGLGIVVSIFFLYLILSSLFSAQNSTTVPEEYKNKLIEAQLIIEKSNKDLGNREVFNENIKKAESIIFEVRDKQIFLNDVKKLLTDISILKKQMNGVESFDPKSTSAEYLFTDTAFGLQNVFEVSKKLYFVGKTSLVGPYVKGGEVKTYTYPDGEEALSSDTSGDGYIYIFTKTGRLIRFYKGGFAYVNVEGQKTWEKGKEIRFFNSNLYVLSEDGQQIYKHKPGVNGFASRSDVLDTKDTKGHNIISFGIDGGFYILKEDLSIDKIFGLPAYSKKSIVINNLPENYAQDGNESPEFFIAQNLNYVYLLLSNRIWIFEPDSKNYRDVKSIKYIGQIEFVDGKVRTIYVPKDGTIIAGSDAGIYTINFEVSDGKVIVR
ncbi:MAG: hypothetical protein Q8K26_03975, partial [Candidatus Gracilibacteria bacterium]|nr:hypothetical protein [Candidatus Gracilibacteria bacterium]